MTRLRIYDFLGKELNEELMALEDAFNIQVTAPYWRDRSFEEHWSIVSNRVWDTHKSYNTINSEVDVEGLRSVRLTYIMLALEALQGADLISREIVNTKTVVKRNDKGKDNGE